MVDGIIVLKEQSYSFFEIFKSLFYKRRRTDSYVLFGFYIFFVLLFIYGNSFHFWILFFPFILCFLLFVEEILSAIKNIFKLRMIWKQYDFSIEKSMLLIEKDHCLFMQNGNRLINLSNCMAKNMVSVIDRKMELIVSVNYLNVFFVISKSEACYEKIRYYVGAAGRCENAICPDGYFYQEKISRLCYSSSLSDKIDPALKMKNRLWKGILLVDLFINIAVFWYLLYVNLLFPKSYSSIAERIIFYLYPIVGLCLICFMIGNGRKELKLRRKEKELFIRSFDQFNIYMRSDMVVLSNLIHYIEIPLDKNFIRNITDGSKGHFLFDTCYGNFYINIPEQETEKLLPFGLYFYYNKIFKGNCHGL